MDPTEFRHQSCIQFFSKIMHTCFKWGMCMYCGGCCVGICAPDSEGAQECAGEAGRAARACCRIAHIIWRGIIFTRVIGMGCMTAQMIHEAETPWDGQKKGKPPPKKVEPPTSNKIKDRGAGLMEKEDDAKTAATADEVVEFDEMKFPWETEKRTRRNAPRSMAMDRGVVVKGTTGEEEKVEEDAAVQKNQGRQGEA
jgi:hypothetical protein